MPRISPIHSAIPPPRRAAAVQPLALQVPCPHLHLPDALHDVLVFYAYLQSLDTNKCPPKLYQLFNFLAIGPTCEPPHSFGVHVGQLPLPTPTQP